MWAPFTLDTLVDITSWGRTYEVLLNTNEGDYDDLGIYQRPTDVEQWVSDYGIIAVMNNKTFVPAQAGAYTGEDMYCITRSAYEIGNLIKDENNIYKVHEEFNASPYDLTHLHTYKIKHQGRMEHKDVRARQDIR